MPRLNGDAMGGGLECAFGLRFPHWRTAGLQVALPEASVGAVALARPALRLWPGWSAEGWAKRMILCARAH